MPVNKNAQIRYNTLDKCFRNPYRKYFIEDLIKACNEALTEFNGKDTTVSRRTILKDIKFMESSHGWEIDLLRIPDDKRKYYRYDDTEFSIAKKPVTENEADLIKNTLAFLQRFKGMPQFEWLEEITTRFNKEFLSGNAEQQAIIEYDQNPFLTGLKYLEELYYAILYKKVLKITYQSYKQNEPNDIVIHPYLLKEYNKRWFLFGYNNDRNEISNLALDRIQKIKEVKNITYRENDIDFEEYFEDIVGVTKLDAEPVKIILEIDRELWPYIESKPLHGSQKNMSEYINDKTVRIELELIPNYEFESILLGKIDKIKIIEPESLKNRILERIKKFTEKHS